MLSRRQAIIWINDGLIYWYIHVSLGLNELIKSGSGHGTKSCLNHCWFLYNQWKPEAFNYGQFHWIFLKIWLKITHSKFQLYIPGANELRNEHIQSSQKRKSSYHYEWCENFLCFRIRGSGSDSERGQFRSLRSREREELEGASSGSSPRSSVASSPHASRRLDYALPKSQSHDFPTGEPMMSWHRNTPRMTGLLWRESTCQRNSTHEGVVYVFFVVSLNKLFNKQLGCQWFEMPWCSCDVTIIYFDVSVQKQV